MPHGEQRREGGRDEGLRGAEKLLKEKNVKLVLDIHLDPNHMAFMLFEAPSAEAVRDFVVQGGFDAFLDCHLYLVTPIPEVLKSAGNSPIFYP